MTKLNQILAVEKGLKAAVQRTITEFYHAIQRSQLLTGISRTYRPLDEESNEILPPEHQPVRLNAMLAFREVAGAFVRLIDITAVKDFANMDAVADIVVDGHVLAHNVPVTHLLFLEKTLTDVQTVINKLPVLDSSESWELDENLNPPAYRTPPVETQRSKKVPKVLVRYEATDKHPAQTDVYQEDNLVGYWSKVSFSGAVPASDVRRLTTRVEKLLSAVKYARETANSISVTDQNIGGPLMAYILDGSFLES